MGSRAVAERLLAAGEVRVDGSAREKSHRLSGGEQVELEPPVAPPAELEPEQMSLVVPYEDEHVLVVDKPAWIVVHPRAGHTTGTLAHGLVGHEAAGGDEPGRPGIVHRLDRDTSGLLVVARSAEAHRRISEFHDRQRTGGGEPS